MRYNIAIDGPAGAGKSTVARKVAEKLGLVYIDTGAMYRAITLEAIKQRKEDRAEIAEIAKNLRIEMRNNKIYLNGQDVTDEIRSSEVTQRVSEIAKLPEVRYYMTKLQRRIAQNKGVILDGRDIGTVVLPDADYKFFLTADIKERARRRYEEMLQRGLQVDLKKVEEDIINRDQQDLQRSCSPLSIPDDAIIIDTTNMSIDDVVLKIIQYVR